MKKGSAGAPTTDGRDEEGRSPLRSDFVTVQAQPAHPFNCKNDLLKDKNNHKEQFKNGVVAYVHGIHHLANSRHIKRIAKCYML